MFFAYLGLACILTAVLAVREAYRFRLLAGPFAGITVYGSALAVLAWLAVVGVVFYANGFWASLAVLAISLFFGVVLRALLAPRDIFSRAAESKSRAQVALADALRRPPVKAVLRDHDKTADDLSGLYSHLCACGVDRERSAAAILNPELLDWFFSDPLLADDRRILLILWAKSGRRPTQAGDGDSRGVPKMDLDDVAERLLREAEQKPAGDPTFCLMMWALEEGQDLPVSSRLLQPLEEIVTMQPGRTAAFLRPPTDPDQTEEALAKEIAGMSPEDAASRLWEEALSQAIEKYPSLGDRVRGA